MLTGNAIPATMVFHIKSFSRPVAAATAAPLAGRTAVRWYGRQGGIVATTGGMVTTPPARVAIALLPSCSCGGPSAQLPLQTRGGAAARSFASKARRSPTVRREERQTKQQRPPGPLSSGSAASSGSAFPDDLTIMLPALDVAMDGLGSDLTKEECLEVLASARRIVQSKAGSSSAEALQREYNLTPYKLHTVGVFLLFSASKVREGSRCSALSMILLNLAANAGAEPQMGNSKSSSSSSSSGGGGQFSGAYMPSVLTIINLFGAHQPADAENAASAARMRKTHIYKSAERQFLAYLDWHNSAAAAGRASSSSAAASSDDLVMQANAFTLAGTLAEAAGDAARALRWYKAARVVGQDIRPRLEGEDEQGKAEVASEAAADAAAEAAADIQAREPKWDWERKCLLGIGRLQAAEATTTTAREAHDALRTAALALSDCEACMLLATKYAEDGDGALRQGQELERGREQQQEKEAEITLLLQRAAIDDVSGASAALAERESMKAVLAELGGEGAGAGPEGRSSGTKKNGVSAFHRMLADEWQRIADASAAANATPTQEA